MAQPAEHLVVITGGPGAGKSTLIDALRKRGYATTPEAGRAIIRQQQAIGGSALPWADAGLFAELMLSWDMRSYDAHVDAKGLVFFDRGVPDVAGYLRLIGQTVPDHMAKAAADIRYSRRVFVCSPWREIFHTDDERKQTFDEARRTCETLMQTYRSLGYELVDVPKVDVQTRADFILALTARIRPATNHPQGSKSGGNHDL